MTDVKEFERFYTRDGFNKSLNHFNSVLSAIGELQNYNNLADVLNNLLQDGIVEQHQLLPIINSLLVDKYEYLYKSINLKETITDLDKIFEETSKWSGIDLIIGYHNPNIGYLVINPKRKESLYLTSEFKNNELLTIYAGDSLGKNGNKYSDKVIEEFIKLLNNKKVKVPSQVLDGKYKVKSLAVKTPLKKEKKVRSVKTSDNKTVKKTSSDKETVSVETSQPSASKPQEQIVSTGGGAVRMTPLYSVPVTNELFHNGNVEAWKRIINSYKTKYAGLDVIIFYDGERIHDINTLFKWGKVKHGCSILFAVSGKDIKDVAKLQRYLKQGASQRFEDFLKFPVNAILKLF